MEKDDDIATKIPTNIVTNDLILTMKNYAIGLQEINIDVDRTKSMKVLEIGTDEAIEDLNSKIKIDNFDKYNKTYSKPLIKSIIDGTFNNDKFKIYTSTYLDVIVYFLIEKTANEIVGIYINTKGTQYNF